jgi:hypothetical protein
MLLKRPSPGKQQPPKEIVKGIFMPKEQRIETRNEICRAHFNLGSEEVSKQSYNVTSMQNSLNSPSLTITIQTATYR